MIRFNRWKWFCRNFKTITNQFLSDIPWKIIKSLSIMSKRPPQHENYGLADQNEPLFESPLLDQRQLKKSKYF